MAISHKIGDILFSDIKTNRKSFVPLNNGEIFQYDTDALNEDYGVGGALPFFINAVEIDWNGAQLKNGSTVKATLNTTGEMLSILQTAYNYATTYNVKYSGGKLYDDKGTEIKVGSTLSGATTTTLGGIKTKYHTTGNAAIVDTTSTTVTNRNYGVETDGAYLAFVKVPWTDTDTKVTSAANHYTPAADSSAALSASASGATAAWGTQVVKGVTVSRDAKGHITGISVQSAAIPAQPTSVSGNAGTATKLATARTLTIGSKGKTFDGSANVAWTLSEIGAAAASHTHDDYITTTTANNNYAAKGHTHDDYITTSTADGKYAAKKHEHTEYAVSDHKHTDLATKNHASTATTFGVGTSANYGHLKISNAYSTQSTAADVALSLGGAYNMFNYFTTLIASMQDEINTLKEQVTTLQGYHATVAVTGVSLNKTSATLTSKGATIQLTATVSPNTATNKSVTWKSSNTSVATVSTSGLVTSVGNGSATITVTTADGAKTATCAITVAIAVTGVSLNKTSTSIVFNKTEQLTATVSPSEANNKNVSWTSSKESVATVSNTGLVTAKGVGSATITVTTADGAKTATCAVTVTAASNTVTIKEGSTTITANSTKEKTYSTTTFTLTATTTSGSGVTWKSSDQSVATITNAGVVTMLKAGSTIITASVAAGTNYASGSASFTLKVNLASQSITLSPTSLSWTASEALIAKTITVSGYKGTISASSNNNNVTATVSGSNVTVTPKAYNQSATITITANAVSEKYSAASKTATATVAAQAVKYYWYEGWTKPTSSNIATLVSNANGVASRGAVVTSLDATELVKSTETIKNSTKANIYVVIPTGYKIYDITLGIDVTNTSFTEVTDTTITNHKVYTFNDPVRSSTSIYIRK